MVGTRNCERTSGTLKHTSGLGSEGSQYFEDDSNGLQRISLLVDVDRIGIFHVNAMVFDLNV